MDAMPHSIKVSLKMNQKKKSKSKKSEKSLVTPTEQNVALNNTTTKDISEAPTDKIDYSDIKIDKHIEVEDIDTDKLQKYSQISEGLDKAIKKMKDDGISEVFIHAFVRFYEILKKGGTEYIHESDIEPITGLSKPNSSRISKLVSKIDGIVNNDDSQELLDKVMIIKLNGGLGTTMGLDKAKSLLEVKGGYTFLDIILMNLFKMREKYNTYFPLMFMNSFRTSADTLSYIDENYGTEINPVFGNDDEMLPLEIIQNHEPKLRASDLCPVEYPNDRSLEWCPPGHGDFYTVFYSSGVLKKYIDCGFEYAFVSNSDNLGAVFDLDILNYFVDTNATIMLELADKTVDDIKGGHVVKNKDGKLLLREVAQITQEDKEIALDPKIHPYFNTNSIWLHLPSLYQKLKEVDGVLELPLIKNIKTVNPNDKESEKVIQIESAIASAICVFDQSAVINVSRSRFLPVKTHEDLERLRSKEYVLDKNFWLHKS